MKQFVLSLVLALLCISGIVVAAPATQSLPYSKMCVKYLKPVMKKANVSAAELNTTQGVKKLAALRKTDEPALYQAFKYCKKDYSFKSTKTSCGFCKWFGCVAGCGHCSSCK